jgi:DNA-binding IclR family transcriptional regulator
LSKLAIVKSASRVLDILEFVTSNNARRPTFTDILNQFNIPKSSLSYLLQELLQQEYIKYEPGTRTYYPGVRLIRLSAICLNGSNIFEEIWFGIKKLSDETGETAHAAVLNGRHVTYISKVQGKEDLGLVTITGLRLPAHATAVGKMLLSSLPESTFHELMAEIKLERLTEQTIVDTEQLWQELLTVAKQGYATELQESTVGACCVSGPVYDSSNKIIASISVTFSASRATPERFAQYIKSVTNAAQFISQMLGYSESIRER